MGEAVARVASRAGAARDPVRVLFAAVRNEAIDRYRLRKRRPEVGLVEEVHGTRDEAARDARDERADLRRRLVRVLRAMKPRDRRIALHTAKGLPAAEGAARLGLKLDTYYAVRARMRERAARRWASAALVVLLHAQPVVGQLEPPNPPAGAVAFEAHMMDQFAAAGAFSVPILPGHGLAVWYGPEVPIPPEVFATILESGEPSTTWDRWRLTIAVGPLLPFLPQGGDALLEIAEVGTGVVWYVYGQMGACPDAPGAPCGGPGSTWFYVQSPPTAGHSPMIGRLRLRAFVDLAGSIHETRTIWIESIVP